MANPTRKGITHEGSQQIQLIRELMLQELELIELSKIDFILNIFNIFKQKKQGTKLIEEQENMKNEPGD